MWTILEIVKDRALLQTVREEVVNACVTTDIDGNETFHIEKVTSLPLLQSVFTEILRLHMNFNLMRNVNEEIVLDGIIFQPGSMLQAPMRIAHFEEAVWGHPGHPATEFWAERHIAPDKGGENTRSFSMAGRPSSYYPFGKLASQLT
jgi:cytochrome P450